MKKNQLTGIRLLAHKLNVSTATISRALNPDTAHLVKEDRRNKILELADKLRYRPNPGARLIQRGVSPTLTILIKDDPRIFYSGFYGGLINGMIQSTQHTDWDIRIATLKNTSGNILDRFRQVGLGCSGIIYMGKILTIEEMDLLSEYHGPLVMIRSVISTEYSIDKFPNHVVGVDHYKGAFAAAKYIIKQGHRDIGLILGEDDRRDFSDRKRGYIDAIKQAKISIKEDMFFYGSHDEDSGKAGLDYFSVKKQMPTALICANDAIAFGAMSHVKDHGLDCPNDISIIGFDDDPWTTACSPKLTTMHQPLEELAARSIDVLTKSIVDSSLDYCQRIILDTDLKIRESVGPPRSAEFS